MKRLTTLNTQRPSFSIADDQSLSSLHLKVPGSWNEMTQNQLKYVLWIKTHFTDNDTAKSYILMRMTGLKPVKKTSKGWLYVVKTQDGKRRYVIIDTQIIASMLDQLGYVDSYETMDNRLEVIGGCHAVDTLLHGVRFVDWLNIEKYYQAYMNTNDEKYINSLACLLYVDKHGAHPSTLSLTAEEKLGTFMWVSYIKSVFAYTFPHFFKPSDSDEDLDMRKMMDIQIRALTDGDVTKEQAIFDTDCWRALTELDAKARESEEFNRKYNK